MKIAGLIIIFILAALVSWVAMDLAKNAGMLEGSIYLLGGAVFVFSAGILLLLVILIRRWSSENKGKE